MSAVILYVVETQVGKNFLYLFVCIWFIEMTNLETMYDCCFLFYINKRQVGNYFGWDVSDCFVMKKSSWLLGHTDNLIILLNQVNVLLMIQGASERSITDFDKSFYKIRMYYG